MTLSKDEFRIVACSGSTAVVRNRDGQEFILATPSGCFTSKPRFFRLHGIAEEVSWLEPFSPLSMREAWDAIGYAIREEAKLIMQMKRRERLIGKRFP